MNYLTSSYVNSSIAQLATRYVGQYLDGIEPDKFEVAWKGGNLQLNDVRIRQEVVDLIGIPINLVYGWVGNVKISLPIGNLFRGSAVSQPLIIELDELYIIVTPKPEEQWDDSVLLERYRLNRQRILDEIDVKLLATQAQKQLETTSKEQQGWMARIASRLVEDIRFNIRSIHLRYEDPIGSRAGPFCFGVTLESLLVKTPTLADINGLLNDHESTSRESRINLSGQRKLLRISEIAVYWNSNFDGQFIADSSEQHQFVTSMREIVLNSTSKFPSHSNPESQHYILKPFSCSVLVDISAVPAIENPPLFWTKPKGHAFADAERSVEETSDREDGAVVLESPKRGRTSSLTISKYNLRIHLASLDVSFSKQVFS